MPLINATINSNKINHSASFVLSNNCLDKCPKCGKNVCEHTSVAEAINLQNSVSQDFSTYSSDSSLITKLFNDSNAKETKSTNRISMGAINKLNESFFISQYQKQHMKTCTQCLNNRICFNSNDLNQFMPCFNLRPLSCQVMIIDNETTDRLLKDFFDSQPNRKAILAENQNEDKLEETLIENSNTNENNIETNNTTNNNTNTELPWHSSPKNEVANTNNNSINNDSKGKEKKKKKFSNFRLFSRNNSISKTDVHKSSPNKRAILRSSGLVNCLTSSTSSSSSSCEELRHKLFINKKYKNQQQQVKQENVDEKSKIHTQSDTTDNDQTVLYEEETSTDQSNLTIRFNQPKNDSKMSLCKSIMSLNSKTLEEEDEDNNDYNEMQNIELCPIVVSDIDEFQEASLKEENQEKNSKNNTKKKPTSNSTHFTNCNNNYNSNNFNNNNIVTNHNNTTNINNISNIISVPLNNYLFYNYEKRNDETTSPKETKNSSKVFAETKPDKSDSFNTVKTSTSYVRNMSETPIYQTKTESINSDVTRTPIRQPCYTANNLKKNRRDAPLSKNRLSYFSTCSSTCADESASTSGTFDEITKTDCLSENHHLNDSTTTSTDEFQQIPYKYHSISIVFIIMGLFSINYFQEYFVMFYYFNTEQFYWLIYSLIALFSGQTLTLIIALLTEIDYINCTNPGLNNKNAAVNTIYSPSSLSSSSLPNSKLNDEKQTSNLLNEQANKKLNSPNRSNFNQDLYLIFKNPFSKIFLLVPGFLPICVFVQFFKHVISYRKNTGNQRFKLEFQLSLYLFYNCVFHSLPLAIINSCYFASTTTSQTLSSYYTELMSLFSFSSSYSTSTSTSLSSNSNSYLEDLNLERRNQVVLFLVSIFISISIGICLFTTYFELMKQMNYLSLIRLKTLFYQHLSLNFNSKSYNLGLIEILVYFCYKFCLITSRLSIIAIFWYLFHEWLILAILGHLILSYFFLYITTVKRTKNKNVKTNESNENMLKNSTTESSTTTSSSSSKKVYDFKMKDFDLCADSSTMSSRLENGLFIRNTKRSRLSKHLTLFIICLLSCIDLFVNQLSEIYHLRKVVFYYVFYFVQNFTVLTYWLIQSIMNARNQYQNENSISSASSAHPATTVTTTSSSNLFVLLKSFTTFSSKNFKSDFYTYFTPTQYACYATLIYLFILLFTIFGLILKFLHLHILRKRYRRLYN